MGGNPFLIQMSCFPPDLLSNPAFFKSFSTSYFVTTVLTSHNSILVCIFKESRAFCLLVLSREEGMIEPYSHRYGGVKLGCHQQSVTICYIPKNPNKTREKKNDHSNVNFEQPPSKTPTNPECKKGLLRMSRNDHSRVRLLYTRMSKIAHSYT